MQKIPATQRREVERRAPGFTKAVAVAHLIGSNVPVHSSLEEFVAEDMALVYAALWYAYSEGVDVVFAAPKETSQALPLRQ